MGLVQFLEVCKRIAGLYVVKSLTLGLYFAVIFVFGYAMSRRACSLKIVLVTNLK